MGAEVILLPPVTWQRPRACWKQRGSAARQDSGACAGAAVGLQRVAAPGPVTIRAHHTTEVQSPCTDAPVVRLRPRPRLSLSTVLGPSCHWRAHADRANCHRMVEHRAAFFIRDDAGQDLVEYAMLLAFVVLATIVGIQSLGAGVSDKYLVASSVISGGSTGGASGGNNPGNPTPSAGTPGNGNPGAGNPGRGNGPGGKKP